MNPWLGSTFASDENCYTLPDGSCISPKSCMHGPPALPAGHGGCEGHVTVHSTYMGASITDIMYYCSLHDETVPAMISNE